MFANFLNSPLEGQLMFVVFLNTPLGEGQLRFSDFLNGPFREGQPMFSDF